MEKYEHNDPRYNDVKELLSFAYLKTVCSFLGISCRESDRQDDKHQIDATITRYDDMCEDRIVAPKIDFQLKATSVPDFSNNGQYLKFRVDRTTCRTLGGNRMCPALLSVLVLSPDVNWVRCDMEQLILEGHMYWYNIRTSGAVPCGDSGSVTLSIPVRNTVTPESLTDMLNKAAKLEEIRNAED